MSILGGCIDTPLLVLFPIADKFSAGFCELWFVVVDGDSTLLLVALSKFPGASLSDDSDDSCRRCIIRLDSLLSMSDAKTLPSIHSPPIGFCNFYFNITLRSLWNIFSEKRILFLILTECHNYNYNKS